MCDHFELQPSVFCFSLDAVDVSLNDDQIPAMSSAGVTGGKCCVAKFASDNRYVFLKSSTELEATQSQSAAVDTHFLHIQFECVYNFVTLKHYVSN